MQHFRPSFEDGDEFLGAGDGIITVLVEDPAFGLLGGAELFGQRIALGYKNVRINAAAFLQSGQQLILTGKFRYLFVQFNDIYTPEKFPFTDRLEVGDEVGQDVAALVLETVIQPEECLLNLSFGDLGDGTGCFIFIVTAASPIPYAVDTTASAPGTAGAAQHFLKRTIRWCLDHLSAMPQRLCFIKDLLRYDGRITAVDQIHTTLSAILFHSTGECIGRICFLQTCVSCIALVL